MGLKLNSKVLFNTVLASSVFISSFAGPLATPVFANSDTGTTAVTYSNSYVAKAYDIEIAHGTAVYEFRVFLSDHGLLVSNIEDRSTTLPGYFSLLWDQFKHDGGLSKYHNMTFDEIKAMKTPEPLETMAGPEVTPIKVHEKIVELINRLEKNPTLMERAAKTNLAKLFAESKAAYEKRYSGDYTKETMDPFKAAHI